jgi:DNA-binding IscR family transcriptional regulator
VGLALQSLVHGGILKGDRGPHGGYKLARERDSVTAQDILSAPATPMKSPQTSQIQASSSKSCCLSLIRGVGIWTGAEPDKFGRVLDGLENKNRTQCGD